MTGSNKNIVDKIVDSVRRSGQCVSQNEPGPQTGQEVAPDYDGFSWSLMFVCVCVCDTVVVCCFHGALGVFSKTKKVVFLSPHTSDVIFYFISVAML